MTAVALVHHEEPDEQTVSRMLLEAQKREILSLQNQLRDALEALAGFRPFDDRRLHIHCDYDNRTYRVERLYAVPVSPVYAEFRKAVEERTRLAAEIARGVEVRTHIPAVIAARAD